MSPSDEVTNASAGRGGGPEDTRARILDAARQVLIDEGYDELTLQHVADRAGVGRATIYYQFDSKAGLLDALIGAMELEAGIDRSRDEDHTFAALLERVTDLWEHNAELLRTMTGLATVAPSLAEIIERHDQGRRQRITELVDEIDQDGRLRSDRSEAIDLLWLLTGFHTYDHLRRRSSRTPQEARALLEALATPLIAERPSDA